MLEILFYLCKTPLSIKALIRVLIMSLHDFVVACNLRYTLSHNSQAPPFFFYYLRDWRTPPRDALRYDACRNRQAISSKTVACLESEKFPLECVTSRRL